MKRIDKFENEGGIVAEDDVYQKLEPRRRSLCRLISLPTGSVIRNTAGQSMATSIYKYIGPEHLDKIFSKPDTATLKCSCPKDFNDPYELFLTMDFNIDPEDLACYDEAIGKLPQLPTTCFSNSPVVIPMWAHYAQNHEGFALEFSEKELAKFYKEARFDNVRYSDKPIDNFSDLLARIRHIGKPRYTYLLQGAIFNAAYFTKTCNWSYENERRMVVPEPAVRNVGGILLLDLPTSCITRIIAGAKASEVTKVKLLNMAKQIGCDYLELRIGRSSAVPFFVGDGNTSLTFSAENIAKAEFSCAECLEPLSDGAKKCSWCQIDDSMRKYAASRNPYRAMSHSGILKDYIADMDAIGAVRRKKGKK